MYGKGEAAGVDPAAPAYRPGESARLAGYCAARASRLVATMSQAEEIRVKIARAFEHLLALDAKIGEYLDSDPVTIRRKQRADGETSVFALQVRTPPPLELGVLVGEVAHQLRSAVDHIAHGLVVAAGNTPTRRTAFPVLLNRPAKLEIYGGVSAEALHRVEQVQPYQRQRDPEAHPLHVLTHLWNIDKHRNLHLAAAMLRQSQIFLASPDRRVLLGGQLQSGPLGADDVIGVFRAAGGFDPGVEVQAGGQTFVALADPGPGFSGQPVQLRLEELHQYVSLQLWPVFEPLLA